MTYSITDLGTLQGDAPSPGAINTAGIITGGLMNRAFRYKGGTLAALQLPPNASYASVGGISSSNPEQIAGGIGPSAYDTAALWTDGVYRDLHPFFGGAWSLAADVNDSMIVTGFSDSRAFRLDLTTEQLEILTLPDNDVRPYAINNSGHVAGIAGKGDHTGPWLFFYDQTMHIVPIPGEVQWETVDVNDADVMTGSYRQTAPPYHVHAFTYDFHSHAFKDIHGGPYHTSGAVCINNHGAVVGWVGNAAAEDGMLWTASDGMRPLTDLVDAQSGWTFSGASAINDAGEITGTGFHNGHPRGFLLTPIPSKPGPVHGPPNLRLKELVGLVKEILVAGSGMGILLPSGDIIYPGDGGPVDPDSPLLRLDAAQGDADVGLAMHVLAKRISDPATRALAEKAAAQIALSAAQSAGSSKADTGRSNWVSRLLRDIADTLER